MYRVLVGVPRMVIRQLGKLHPTLCDDIDYSPLGSSVHGISKARILEQGKKKYWSGLSLPSPGNLPDPGIEPMSLALTEDSLPLSHGGNGTKPAPDYGCYGPTIKMKHLKNQTNLKVIQVHASTKSSLNNNIEKSKYLKSVCVCVCVYIYIYVEKSVCIYMCVCVYSWITLLYT